MQTGTASPTLVLRPESGSQAPAACPPQNFKPSLILQVFM